MAEYLVVDGYNIVNAWKVLNKIKEESLEHARDKLLEYLAEYQSFNEQSIIVVFDAHLVKGGQEASEKVLGIDVIYTKEGEIADLVIESLVQELVKNNHIVTVATSDWVEQRIILGQGAYRLSARELWNRIESNVQAIREKKEKIERHQQKNPLFSHLEESVKEKLEKMRRGEKKI